MKYDMNLVITISSPSEVLNIAQELMKLLSHRSLFLFVGEVGAGKTTIISKLCQMLGFPQAVSPSFSILNRYENEKGQSLDHVDLYRLNDETDLESTGFWDLFQQEKAWVMVEWSDRIADHAWPLDWSTYKVEIEILGSTARRVSISSLN